MKHFLEKMKNEEIELKGHLRYTIYKIRYITVEKGEKIMLTKYERGLLDTTTRI